MSAPESTPIPTKGFTEEVEESDVVIVDMRRYLTRTNVPFPTVAHDGRSWNELFTEVRQSGRDADEATEEEEPTLIRSWVPEKIGSSPTKYLAAAQALGWTTESRASLVRNHDSFYAATSKTKRADGSYAQKGDLKKAAHDIEHLCVVARHPDNALGFRLHYIAGKFGGAIAHDPVVGFPVENWADYSKDKNEIKALAKARNISEEKAQSEADDESARWSAQFNDGTWRVERTALFTKANDFNAWLDDYLVAQAPKHKTLTAKAKALPVAETLEPLGLDSMEWSG